MNYPLYVLCKHGGKHPAASSNQPARRALNASGFGMDDRHYFTCISAGWQTMAIPARLLSPAACWNRAPLQISAAISVLNPAQREAIHYLDGPLLVFAGARSGKTPVITEKIVYSPEGAASARPISLRSRVVPLLAMAARLASV